MEEVKNIVLEVQDGDIDLSAVFMQLDKKISTCVQNLNREDKGGQDGKIS